ncbi:MAG: hypothetical protein ACI4EI_08155 [Muricoprocola sp.]
MGMTIEDLSSTLNKMNIPKDLYSIMTGGLPNEKLCIVKEDKWQVYYSERGHKSGLKIFETEEEACEYFLDKIKRYVNIVAESGVQ